MHNYKFYEGEEQGIRITNRTWIVVFYVRSGKYLEYIYGMYLCVGFGGAEVCGRQWRG